MYYGFSVLRVSFYEYHEDGRPTTVERSYLINVEAEKIHEYVKFLFKGDEDERNEFIKLDIIETTKNKHCLVYLEDGEAKPFTTPMYIRRKLINAIRPAFVTGQTMDDLLKEDEK